ncbi:MAG TPA: hypothetical protein DCS30_10325 [Rhizobiales bacterium]|nr:hypothetical protein [Hyphomicrobiales bacterium]
MKITCPNCTTSYQVPDNYLGENGRKVRCANCGDTWLAKSEADDAKSLEQALDTSQDDVKNMVSGGEEQSQDNIDALFDSASGAGEDQSQDDIDALFDSPSGGGDDQSQDDIDALFDSPSDGGEEQSQGDIDALFDNPSDSGEEQSQGDIDALFGEDDSAPEIDVTQAAMSERSDQDSPVVDMMDADAFEAQKAVAKGKGKTGQDIESAVRKKRHSKGRAKNKTAGDGKNDRLYWLSGGGALVASLMLIVGFFAMPATFVRLSPDFAGLYSMLGMEVNLSGVSLRGVSARLQQKSGTPVISVEADLVNAGGEPVLLPKVELSVLGKDGIELYSWSLEPEGVGLGPGESKTVSSQVAAPVQAKQISLRVTPSK